MNSKLSIHAAPAEGNHTYHVVALYKEGSSDLSNKADVTVSCIDTISENPMSIYTSPATIHVQNAVGTLTVVNANGMVIYSNPNPLSNEKINVAAGVYMVSAGNHNLKVIVK